MPSRFPWSSKTPSSSDHNLDIPRSSSRQEITYTSRQSPLEPPYQSYDPNQQAFLSTTSLDSSSSPPGSSPAGAAPTPQGIQQQQQQQQQRNFAEPVYEPQQQQVPPAAVPPILQQPQQPPPPTFQQLQQQQQQQQPPPPTQPYHPPTGARLQKNQPPPKKSFTRKLLGSSKEEVEHSRDGLFGRKRSVRRREGPFQEASGGRQQDPRGGLHWSHVENPEISQPVQQHRFGFYAPDIDEEAESRAPATGPPELTQYQQAQLQQHQHQQEQQQLHQEHFFQTNLQQPEQQQYELPQQQQQLLQPTYSQAQDTEPTLEPALQDHDQALSDPYLTYTAPADNHQDDRLHQQQPSFQVSQDQPPPSSPVALDSEQAPPSRSSFESFPNPPSRPDSRPISRQSYDRNLGSGPQSVSQTQLDSYQAQPLQDSVANAGQPQGVAAGGSLMAPPSGPRQPRQTQASDGSRINAPPPVSRENSGLPPGLDSNSRTQQLAQEAGEARTRTPPPQQQPQRSASEMTEAEINQLIRDHKELKQKYNNVKRQYFDRKDQVDNLQNTLAQQRIIQSRTQWDDGEYTTRMNRLDGLVSQLAFGMRKDWKVIPEWLQPYCNKDALQIAKQEMTAVGRAFISRWLADELFDRYFHPGLEQDISIQLKTIQRNIREYAPMPHNLEEEEALAARITNWRLATVDGLQPLLGVPEAMSTRQSLIQELNERLVSDIKKHMQDPGPVGLEGGVHMIIELAVAILANLPLESRDVNINYFPPGYPINQEIMKVETSIPPLPGSQAHEVSEGDAALGPNDGHDNEGNNGRGAHEDRSRRGFFGLVGSSSANTQKRNPSPSPGRPPYQTKLANEAAASSSQSSLPQTGRDERVRMCVFLGAQTRGKMVLVKAPVYRV